MYIIYNNLLYICIIFRFIYVFIQAKGDGVPCPLKLSSCIITKLPYRVHFTTMDVVLL